MTDVGFDGRDQTAAGQAPEQHFTAGAAAGEQRSIRTDGHAQDGLRFRHDGLLRAVTMTCQCFAKIPIGQRPEANAAIATASYTQAGFAHRRPSKRPPLRARRRTRARNLCVGPR